MGGEVLNKSIQRLSICIWMDKNIIREFKEFLCKKDVAEQILRIFSAEIDPSKHFNASLYLHPCVCVFSADGGNYLFLRCIGIRSELCLFDPLSHPFQFSFLE